MFQHTSEVKYKHFSHLHHHHWNPTSVHHPHQPHQPYQHPQMVQHQALLHQTAHWHFASGHVPLPAAGLKVGSEM